VVFVLRGSNECSMWFVNASDEKSTTAAVKKAEEFVVMCQEDQEESEKALFPNHTRTGVLEQRYRGEDRRERLRNLKQAWDPEGVFTRQFL
jgi:hypothetical protein